MDTPSEKPTTLSKAEPRMPGTFSLLQTTFLVGLILATLFTAWNPNASASTPPDNQLTQLIGASSTQVSGAAAPQNNSETSNRIGIVAGHWGNDSGAGCADGGTGRFPVEKVVSATIAIDDVVDGFQQLLDPSLVAAKGITKTINQRIAALVQKSLTEQGFQVDVLREFDYGLSNYKAAVLVSIHSDSCDYINDQATGFKVAAALGSTRKEKAVRLTACLRARYGAAVSGSPTSRPVRADS